MKPILTNKINSSYISDILKTFENDKPLSGEQINFLARHEKVLSSYALDPVISYYLKPNKAKKELMFDLAEKKITALTLQHIKQHVQQLLTSNLDHVDLKMTLDQFQHFKTIGIHELIFWHGNQFLTGAPFFPGGIPHLIYVQWGDLFGVVKLQLISAEKKLKGHVRLYLETRKERTLYQCIKDYSHHMKLTLNNQNIPTDKESEHKSVINRPTLILKPFYNEIH